MLFRARADEAFAASPGDDTNLAGTPVPIGGGGLGGGPPTHKLMVGDWIAQWDASYNAWFFYNIKTGKSLKINWSVRKHDKKMPQRRDNAGAVCDSGIGMLFLNRQFLSYRRLLHQKMG